MNYQSITVELDENKVLLVSINRPDKMNALNSSVIQELDQMMSSVVDDSSICGIIITGVGEKAFVAGADIAEFANYNRLEGTEMAAKGHQVFDKIERSSIPVIAAVNGFALGGGCELAMACHMRIASENAKFGQPEVNLGIIPGYGGTQRLPQLVGKGRAMQMILTGDMVDAKEAHRIGLVNEVIEQDALIERAKKIISKISRKGPKAVANSIKLINLSFESNANGYETEIALFGQSFETDEFAEGTNAFVEKRKASFSRS